MRFNGMRGRIEKLEAKAHRGLTPTTDSTGNRAWLSGSGLQTAFGVLKFQHDSGKGDLCKDDLPSALRENVSLWSRAETEGQGQAAAMVKEMCIQIMGGRRPES
jgi:hypothetical protein